MGKDSEENRPMTKKGIRRMFHKGFLELKGIPDRSKQRVLIELSLK
jgi:hypothetical protein